MNENFKQFRNRCGLAMMAYIFLAIAVQWAIDQIEATNIQHLLVIAPMIPLFLAARAVIAYVKAVDEVERAIITESVIISFIVLVFGTQGYGFLETFLDYPPLPALTVFPALAVTFWLAFYFVRRKYQ